VYDLSIPAAAEHRPGNCNGISRRLIAARFKVSADAAWRHGRAHLTPEILAALATKVLAREGDMHRILLEGRSGLRLRRQAHASRGGLRLRRQAHASRADQAGIGRLETPEGAADGPLQKDIPVVRAAERKVGRRQVAVRPPPLGCPTAPPHAWMGDATGFQ